jgi:UDP-3-O-[3-hydroxymyristoyl] glucosamine N-acyltransferase
LSRIAAHAGCELVGDPERRILGAAAFEDAGADHIALAGSARYLKRVKETGAGALVVPLDFRCEGKNLLRAENPGAAFARAMELFHRRSRPAPGIHPTAVVGPGFVCGEGASVAAHVVVGRDVSVGPGCILHPNVVLGDRVVLGDGVEIYPNCTVLEGCRIGSRVTIHPGSVIGADGFGFAPEGEGYVKIPHLGTVVIEDDVEIGAGNTIDRGKFGPTLIGRGVKTDNLVHIAHNVTVGENTVIVAQAGISGSVRIGRHAVLAGQAGVAGHLSIGDGAVVGPQAGVSQSVPAGAVVSGSPEIPHRLWLRVQRVVPMLPDMKKAMDRMEKRLRAVEETLTQRNGDDGSQI